MGTPEDVETGLVKLTDHEPPTDVEGALVDEEAVFKVAIVQGMYFETPSAHVSEVREFDFPDELYEKRPHECPGIDLAARSWTIGGLSLSIKERIAVGIDGDFSVPESVIAPALVKARIAFGDNLRGKNIVNLKSGKVNPRHLGKRAPVGDARLMRKRLRPSNKSYFVLIGIDVSQSTTGQNILLAKQLAMAEAEMLSRLPGVKFAIYAHSGKYIQWEPAQISMNIYNVKTPDQPWDDRARQRLELVGPDSINLDGHTLEFYRKVLDKRNETERILHYYTDGAMPAANFAEELAVLQREIKVCRQRGYVLLGVGIRTDSPTQHGLKTIQLDEQADILLVIKDLEQELLRR